MARRKEIAEKHIHSERSFIKEMLESSSDEESKLWESNMTIEKSKGKKATVI